MKSFSFLLDYLCSPYFINGAHLQQYNVFCSGVIDRVISELKQILKRDFNKKMIENTAFKSFENWWDEQERKSKVRALQYISSQWWAVCSDIQSS